jgi:hypothetical protein
MLLKYFLSIELTSNRRYGLLSGKDRGLDAKGLGCGDRAIDLRSRWIDGRKKVRLVVNVRTFRCCRGIGWRTIDVMDVTLQQRSSTTREGQHRRRRRRQLARSSPFLSRL